MISSYHSFWLGVLSCGVLVFVIVIFIAFLWDYNCSWNKEARLYKRMQKFATKHNVTIITANSSFRPEEKLPKWQQ